MAWETWIIDGDTNNTVLHPAGIIRTQTFVSYDGKEGVIGATDLRVLALATPGTSIRTMTGAASVHNRAVGAFSESYAIKNTTEDVKPVTATGAGVTRSDLVVAIVKNPFLSGEGWTNVTGPFSETLIIPNVSATARDVHVTNPGYSAITLARIDIPASTGTITQAMIKDMRSTLTTPRATVPTTQTEFAQSYATRIAVGLNKTTSVINKLLASNTSFINFPDTASWNVPIPPGATHMDYSVQVTNAHLLGGDVWGFMKLLVNGVSLPEVGFDLNQNASGNSGGFRQQVGVVGTYILPTTIRNTSPLIRMQARNIADARVVGTLYNDADTYTFAYFNFYKMPTLT